MLYTLALVVTQFYKLDQGDKKICSDNLGVLLGQSSKSAKRTRMSAKQAGLLQAMWMLKSPLLHFGRKCVDLHMDEVKLSQYLTLG